MSGTYGAAEAARHNHLLELQQTKSALISTLLGFIMASSAAPRLDISKLGIPQLNSLREELEKVI
jgi:hypothetical protein